jgi:hypothetical protein
MLLPNDILCNEIASHLINKRDVVNLATTCTSIRQRMKPRLSVMKIYQHVLNEFAQKIFSLKARIDGKYHEHGYERPRSKTFHGTCQTIQESLYYRDHIFFCLTRKFCDTAECFEHMRTTSCMYATFHVHRDCVPQEFRMRTSDLYDSKNRFELDTYKLWC